jgi:hypothetical protein
MLTVSDVNVTYDCPMGKVTSFSALTELAYGNLLRATPASSTGAELSEVARTYGDAVANKTRVNGVTVSTAVSTRTANQTLMLASAGRSHHTGIDLIQAGAASLFKASVKKEPNPDRKRDQPRVVVAPGYEHTLGLACAIKLYDFPGLAHSAMQYGYGPQPEKLAEQRKRVLKYAGSHTNLIKSDVSRWDFTYSARSMRWVCYIFALSTDTDLDLADYYHNVATTLSNPVLIGPDGYIYQRTHEGGMCSGTLLTTFANTTDRVAKSIKAGTGCCCLGDDAIEFLHKDITPDTVKASYAAMHLNLRGVEVQSVDDYEFCSHQIKTDDTGAPTWAHSGPEKSVFRMLCKNLTLSQIGALLRLNFSSAVVAGAFKGLLTTLNREYAGVTNQDGAAIADFDGDEFDLSFMLDDPLDRVFEA